jgi:hypothetical protein
MPAIPIINNIPFQPTNSTTSLVKDRIHFQYSFHKMKRLTLELTGRERAAYNIIGEDEHERKAIERSG